MEIRKETPAFPIHYDNGEHDFGLTKREYFAGLAMQGIIGTLGSKQSVKATDDMARKYNSDASEIIAKMAVEYADALIKELNK